MKILNFGSVNIDFTYRVPHFVRPGETLSARSVTRNAGGKGFNQSVALSKAGCEVWHAGHIGADGAFLLELCEGYGVKTDYKYILSYLQTVVKALNLDVQFICYDPHNASAFLTDLDALGYDSVAITQSAKALNDATVDFRLEIESGNVEHDGNEMTTWSIANAKTVSNSFGEIKIDKEYQTERIDPVDAIIDAWTMAMKGEVKPDVNESVEMWLKMYESSRARKTERG